MASGKVPENSGNPVVLALLPSENFGLPLYFQGDRLPSFASDVSVAASRTGLDPSVPAPYQVFGSRLSRGCPCRHQ